MKWCLVCTCIGLWACDGSTGPVDPNPRSDGGGDARVQDAGRDGSEAGPDGDATADAAADAAVDAAADATGDSGDIEDAGDGDGDTLPPPGCTLTPAPEGTDHSQDVASGTRLEAQLLSAEGMPDVFVGFWDRELQVTCNFVTAADGTLRCLPRDAVVDTREGYADAACTRPLASAPAVCSERTGYTRSLDACGDRTQVHRWELLDSETQVYRRQGGECVDSGDHMSMAPTHFVASEPVAPESFVSGTVETLPGGCKGNVQIVTTAGGARGPLAITDAETGARCGASNESGFCRPTRMAFPTPGLFSDAACSEGVMFASWSRGPECEGPELLGSSSGDYHWVEGVYEGDVYAGNPCVPAREKPWIGTIFESGTSIQASDLAELEVERAGSARLQAHRISEAGVVLQTGRTGMSLAALYDSELERACEVLPFDDGTYRCVPTDTTGRRNGPLYQDPTCTEPAVACAEDDCTGRVFFSTALDAATCATELVATSVWRATEPATGSYIDAGHGCQGVTLSGSQPWLAAEVAIDSLPQVQLRTLESP